MFTFLSHKGPSLETWLDLFYLNIWAVHKPCNIFDLHFYTACTPHYFVWNYFFLIYSKSSNIAPLTPDRFYCTYFFNYSFHALYMHDWENFVVVLHTLHSMHHEKLVLYIKRERIIVITSVPIPIWRHEHDSGTCRVTTMDRRNINYSCVN